MAKMKVAGYKKMNGSSWITKTRRLAIYLRDGFCCQSCGRDLMTAKPAEVQLDHLKCRSHGGGNESTNLVTTCRSCNSSRGDKQWTKFYGTENVTRIRKIVRRKLNVKLARELVSERKAA